MLYCFFLFLLSFSGLTYSSSLSNPGITVTTEGAVADCSAAGVNRTERRASTAVCAMRTHLDDAMRRHKSFGTDSIPVRRMSLQSGRPSAQAEGAEEDDYLAFPRTPTDQPDQPRSGENSGASALSFVTFATTSENEDSQDDKASLGDDKSSLGRLRRLKEALQSSHDALDISKRSNGSRRGSLGIRRASSATSVLGSNPDAKTKQDSSGSDDAQAPNTPSSKQKNNQTKPTTTSSEQSLLLAVPSFVGITTSLLLAHNNNTPVRRGFADLSVGDAFGAGSAAKAGAVIVSVTAASYWMGRLLNGLHSGCRSREEVLKMEFEQRVADIKKELENRVDKTLEDHGKTIDNSLDQRLASFSDEVDKALEDERKNTHGLIEPLLEVLTHSVTEFGANGLTLDELEKNLKAHQEQLKAVAEDIAQKLAAQNASPVRVAFVPTSPGNPSLKLIPEQRTFCSC